MFIKLYTHQGEGQDLFYTLYISKSSFKLKAMALVVNREATAQELGINESMVRQRTKQRGELTQCKKTNKAF